MRVAWLRCVVLLVAAFSTCGVAGALDVRLTNGQRITGEVTLDAKTVHVRAGTTTYNIPRGSLKSVTLSAPERFEYEKRRAMLGDSADARVALGKWLDQHFQHADAAALYEEAITLDANHADARKALGFRREGGKWVRNDEDLWRIRAEWLGPEAAEACYQLAKRYHARGEEKEVEPLLRRALMANPRHAGALALMRPITDRYRSKNDYRLPVEGTWGIVHDYNDHHKKAAFMTYALDFMKVGDDLKATRVPRPTKVEDYYTWDATIHAAADGEVYALNDGYRDSALGGWTDFHSANTVCIRHAGGEYTVYGHLKNGSITVKKGDTVKAGQVIARGGNSGSSGWPHMHFAMYDRDGIGLPCTFVDYREVTRDGGKDVARGRLQENHLYHNTFAKDE